MDIDLDQYYTPIDLIQPILSEAFPKKCRKLADTSCGKGNLLIAAKNAFGEIRCIGLDKDKSSISSLKRSQPQWALSVADILKMRSYQRAGALSDKNDTDLLLLNPPFSQKKSKSIPISYSGVQLRTSVAMAHVLQSLELFKPKMGAMVVVPESVLFSEIDAQARSLIEADFHIDILNELSINTFAGARVRSTVIKIAPGASRRPLVSLHKHPELTKIQIEIIKGGLPVFEAKKSRSKFSLPFIHSTDIRNLVEKTHDHKIMRTHSTRAGKASGHLVLLPRVGVPLPHLIHPIFFKSKAHLSDCVIALKFENKLQAEEGSNRLRKNAASLQNMYRGTGARYVTRARLEMWLRNNGFVFQPAATSRRGCTGRTRRRARRVSR